MTMGFFLNIVSVHICKSMKKILYPMVILLLAMLISCNKENRVIEEVKRLQGANISFIDGYKYDCPDSSLSESACLQSKIKMISYWEDFSCTPCACKVLLKWEQSFREKIGPDVKYVFIVNSKKNIELISELRKSGFSLPILSYSDKSFGTVNKLNVLARNKTFLLDDNNRIVVVGEPFGNDKLWDVYIEAIKVLRNN